MAEACRREAELFKLDGMNPASVQPVEAADARLLLDRSCRSTTLSTVEELAVNPAEFGKLADDPSLWNLLHSLFANYYNFSSNTAARLGS